MTNLPARRRTAHAGCTHPTTSAARAKCRRIRQEAASKINHWAHRRDDDNFHCDNCGGTTAADALLCDLCGHGPDSVNCEACYEIIPVTETRWALVDSDGEGNTTDDLPGFYHESCAQAIGDYASHPVL